MENNEKNKPGEQDQSGDPKKVNRQQGKEQEKVNPQEDKERNEGLEKTHQTEHQPLPGEGTDEAKGIADDKPEDC